MVKCRLPILLAERGIKQADLARLANVRPATLSDMCKGKNKHISLDVLDRICNVLDCNVSDIYNYEKS